MELHIGSGPGGNGTPRRGWAQGMEPHVRAGGMEPHVGGTWGSLGDGTPRRVGRGDGTEETTVGEVGPAPRGVPVPGGHPSLPSGVPRVDSGGRTQGTLSAHTGPQPLPPDPPSWGRQGPLDVVSGQSGYRGRATDIDGETRATESQGDSGGCAPILEQVKDPPSGKWTTVPLDHRPQNGVSGSRSGDSSAPTRYGVTRPPFSTESPPAPHTHHGVTRPPLTTDVSTRPTRTHPSPRRSRLLPHTPRVPT